MAGSLTSLVFAARADADLKKLLINLFKYGVPLAIVIWLIRGAVLDDSFERLKEGHKDWPMLAAAWLVCTVAVVLTFIRWYFLVRALDIPFRMRDAFRLGFLGYLFNFVAPGGVGGDLFKAIFIAREQPNHRAEAVASVAIDRIIGLYALFIIATVALLCTDAGREMRADEKLHMIATGTFACTFIGALGIVALLVPGVTSGKLSQSLARLPRVGHTIDRLIGAIRIYRRKPGVLVLTVGLSILVQSLFAVGFYLIARGLPGGEPSLAAHFLIVPMAMVTGVLPFFANGLGAFEAVVEYLYRNMPGVSVPNGQGLLVSLTYRAITILIALVGLCYYLARRREVTSVLHEAEEETEHEEEGVGGGV